MSLDYVSYVRVFLKLRNSRDRLLNLAFPRMGTTCCTLLYIVDIGTHWGHVGVIFSSCGTAGLAADPLPTQVLLPGMFFQVLKTLFSLV